MTNIAILTTHVFPPHTPTESFLGILVLSLVVMTRRSPGGGGGGGGRGYSHTLTIRYVPLARVWFSDFRV